MHTIEEETEAKTQAQNILNRIQARGTEFAPETLQTAKEIIVNMLLEGITPRESIDIAAEDIEKMYLYSYNLFQAGKFSEALVYFQILHDLDPLDARYCFALAACYHYLKNYHLAIAHYMECSSLDLLNPIPYFHIYDCCIQSDHLFSAYVALHTAATLAGNDPLYKSLKEKAQLELKFLENSLKEDAQKYSNKAKK